MQICPQCHHQNPDGPQYCQRCAGALVAVCPGCQQPWPVENASCPTCGRPLTGPLDEAVPVWAAGRPRGLDALMPPRLADKIKLATPQVAGQKRPVTILSLACRTAAEQLSPANDEAAYLREQALTQLLAEAVYAYEGHIALISGQRMVALFGAPVMHENHAERAIRAALHLKQRWQSPPAAFTRQHGPLPEMSIGINSGTVIVATVGSAVNMEYTAVSDTIKLASNLAQAAAPGSVLVTEATCQLTRPLFEFQPRLALIAGSPEPVPVCEPLAIRTNPAPLRGLLGSVAPMIGRQEVLSQLLAQADKLAERRRSQIVLISGEAGVGKSRLLQEFRHSLDQPDSASISLYQSYCQAHTRSQPYWAMATIVRSLAQVEANDTVESQLHQLTTLLDNLALNRDQVRPFLAYLLGLESASQEIQARLDLFNADMLQKLIHNALRQLMSAAAQQSPLILVVEDLHWIDAASLNALNYLLPSTDSLPILYIFTSREAEAAQTLSSAQPVVTIRLNLLTATESSLLIEHLIDQPAEPAHNLTERIAQRAAGNPFFIEEIIRMLIGMGGIVSQENGWRASADVEACLQKVPDTLQALILARFDSLDEHLRQTLLKAAVLGAAFSTRLLTGLAGLPPETTAAYLQELVLYEFLDPNPQNDSYFTFRHALVPETLYASMLRRPRQTLHEQAAQALEEQLDWPAAERDQLLAHHYSHSPLPDRAIPYLLRTAENAAQQSANETAVEQFKKAVELLQKQGAGESVFQAQIGLGRAHKFLGNYDQAQAILSELLQALLSWSMRADPGSLLRVLAAGFREIADVQMRKGDFEGAIAHLQAGIEALGDKGAHNYALLYRLLAERLAYCYFRQGKLDIALQVAQSAVATMNAGDAHDDPVVMAHLYNTLGGIFWQQGNLSLAASYVRQCLQLYETLNFPWGMANAYSNLGVLNWQQGNWEQAFHDWHRDLVLRREMGDKQYEAVSRLNLAHFHLSVGDFSQAQTELLLALDIFQQLDDQHGIAHANAILAHNALGQQQFELAGEYAQSSIDLADKIGAQAIQIEARLAKALVQAQNGELPPGLATAQEAAEMAATSGQISAEADCLRVTGRLQGQQGEITAAETNLRESLELCLQTSDPYRQALGLLELGRLYQRVNQSGDEETVDRYRRAQAALKEASGIFLALGAQHDLQETEAALAFLQANPPRIQAAIDPANAVAARPDFTFDQRRTATILWLNLLGPDEGADEETVFEMTALALPGLAAIAREYGGHVRQRANGLTVMFGVPVAYEDDTERAVQAAYQMLNQVQSADNQLEFPISLQTVIASGPVIVGQMTGDRQEDLIARGQPIDQAQHAAGLVAPNIVWVTDSVRIATERLFTYHAHPFADFGEFALWRLVELRDIPDPARGLPGVQTRFVGREASLQAMLDLTQNLAEGIGGIIWIEGEAGIGKSRLMREFSAALAPEAFRILKGGCSPQQSNYAFSLIADMLKPFLNLQRTDSSDQIRQRIEQTLSTWPDDVQATQPYLEVLLGVQPVGLAGERLARLEPEQLRQQMFVAIRRLIISLTRRQPLVVFLDDLHWIDPVSAELLLFVFTAVTSAPVLFVCAQRREVSDSPNDRLLRLYSLLPGQTANIMLDRLPPEMSQLLIRDLLPGANFSAELQQTIIARSEGNPYFIEEFVRMFIEQGYVERVDEKWQLVAELDYDPAAIPVSLETLIRSRIDALPEELRHTLQYAAILGQKFEVDLLAAITNNPNVWLTVERLTSRLMLEALGDSNRWQFSHALYETVVYESMLKVHRRMRHHHVAQVLQQLWTHSETEHAKELAYHFMRADEQVKALPYLIRAGEQAAGQYATEEALAYYRDAADIVAQLAQPDEEWQWRIAVGLGEAYRFMGNYAESLAALHTAIAGEKADLLPRLNRADLYRRMGETARKQGDFAAAQNYLATAQQLIGDPEAGPATIELSRILISLAWVYFAQGQLAQTRETCEKSLAYAQAADGLNELATAHNLLGGVFYQAGEWRDAFHHTTRAMILREQMGYSWGVAGTLSNLGILAFVAGNWHKSVSFFERSLNLRQEMGDVEGLAITQNNLGNAYRGQGRLGEAERSFRESVLTAETFSIASHHANSTVGLAHVLLLQGKLAEAQSAIAEGIALAEALGAQDILAEGQRIQAELLLANQAYGPGLRMAEQAAALAAAVGNPSNEAAAWRVAAQAALVLNDFELAETLIQKAAALLTDTTDHLEAAHVAAQAYQIFSRTEKEPLARENLAAAREAYTRLGAAFYLRQLEQGEARLAEASQR